MTAAYPLQWPPGVPRAARHDKSRFKTALPTAINRVKASLAGFAKDSGKDLSNIVISSNASLGDENPAEPGVSVWFTWDQLSVCIAVDRYRTLADNLTAIHHIIEGRRVELRHGTLAMVRATFTGFLAIAAPVRRPPHDVLGVPPKATEAQIKEAFNFKIKPAHPDNGGSQAAVQEVTDARDAMLKQLRAQ
jgi:hypothetical protein